MKKQLWSFAIAGLLMSSSGQAADNFLTLQNLNESQTAAVFKTLGADLVFRPLEPASTFGDYFGFAIGVIGGLTSTNEIKPFISDAPSNIPTADIFLAVQVPFGLALELGFVPQLSLNTAKFQKFGADVKWTLTENLLESLPLDIAARFSYSRPELSYTELTSGNTLNVGFDSNITGFNISASKSFIFIEPFVGLGYLSQNGTLKGTGTGNIFDTTYTASQSVSRSDSSMHFFLGGQLHLAVMNLTLQYDNAFGISNYSFKLGAKF